MARRVSDEAAPKIAPQAKKSEAVTVTLANKSYGVKIAGNTVDRTPCNQICQ